MRVYKTKEFSRFARKEKIDDSRLCDAADRAGRGLIDADLGGGLIKQRIARPGQGRSGGYRTLMAFRSHYRTVFVYGFAKNERANIGLDELLYWQTISTAYIQMSEQTIQKLLTKLDITEIICHDKSKISQ